MSNRRRPREARKLRFLRFPHCPNSKCPFHQPDPAWRYTKIGFFERPSDHRRFRRFRCQHCRRSFSTRTFSADYWLRYRRLFPRIANLSVNGPGLRQVGRILDISHATVGRHLARAGRHCLLFQRERLGSVSIDEPLVIDGFETFEYSQYFPFHMNLAVGAKSWMIYHFTDSPLRRKGTMTVEQQQTREKLERQLGRPDPKAVQEGIVQLLEPLLSAPSATDLFLDSDDHPAYRRALAQLRRRHPQRNIHHRITPSVVRRTTSNPLFPVNLADLLLRHSGANHRRETIAFSKRRQCALERLAVLAVWRNWIKRRREKEAGRTAAQAANLADRPLSWAEVLKKRRFPRAHLLPGPWSDYYWRRVKTAVLGEKQTEHSLAYAF